MPCSDGGWAEAIRRDENIALGRAEAQEDLDRLTRYLCAVLRRMNTTSWTPVEPFIAELERYTDGIEPGELQAWWDQHRRDDTGNPILGSGTDDQQEEGDR